MNAMKQWTLVVIVYGWSRTSRDGKIVKHTHTHAHIFTYIPLPKKHRTDNNKQNKIRDLSGRKNCVCII